MGDPVDREPKPWEPTDAKQNRTCTWVRTRRVWSRVLFVWPPALPALLVLCTARAQGEVDGEACEGEGKGANGPWPRN